MYTVVIMQNNTTPAVYTFETEDAALAYFHNELAYRSAERTSTKAAILDSNFSMIRQETYTAPVQNVEANEGE